MSGPADRMTDREQLGRLVREVWVQWAREQPDPKPSWLTGWDELDDGQREVDMRIGEALAAAEREACARLAEEHRARYDRTKPCGCGRIRNGRPCTVVLAGGAGLPFADLLRGTDA